MKSLQMIKVLIIPAYFMLLGNDGIVPRSRESSPEADAKVGGGERAGDQSTPIFPSRQLGRLLVVFLIQAVELSTVGSFQSAHRCF